MSDIRRRWGLPRPSRSDVASVSLYHDALQAADRVKGLDEQTWEDLNFNDVFEELDHTNSAIGQQVLYHILRTPRDSDLELEKIDWLATRFAEETALREEIQLALSKLESRNAYGLPRLFLQDSPNLSKLSTTIPACTALAVGALCSLPFLNGIVVVVPLFILVLCVLVGLVFRRHFQDFGIPFRSLHALIRVGEVIGGIKSEVISQQAAGLRVSSRNLIFLKRISRYLVFDNHFNEILASAYAYLNTFLLLDLNIYIACIKLLEKQRDEVRNVYETLGWIDAVISIASYRHGLAIFCRPEFISASKRILVEDIYHPLLQNCVPNSIEIEDRSVLLYGANMSGKTTFIRSLGLSVVLAQTICTCNARTYRSPFLRVKSFINRKDDILGGKSYFLKEVVAVRELVRASESPEQCLFLVDELFKGTSPQECTSISGAVLKYLDHSLHITVAATHDATLQHLLHPWVVLHFGETQKGRRLLFDYKIRSGKGKSSSSLALLEAQDYPSDVIENAKRTIESLHGGNIG